MNYFIIITVTCHHLLAELQYVTCPIKFDNLKYLYNNIDADFKYNRKLPTSHF